MNYQIGIFDFISLSRPASGPMARLEREKRPGFGGVTFWRLGVTAEPFQVESCRDAADVLSAESLLHGYEVYAGNNPVPYIWDGRELGLVIVHEVVPIDGGIHATLIGIGGQMGSSHALVRAIWTLEFITVFDLEAAFA